MTRESEALSLRVRRVLHAPRAVVFRALIDPDELARWWGPEGFTIPAVERDLRPGGSFRITMRPPDGEAFHLVGEYRLVEPPERLSYTFRWEEPDPEDRETVVDLALRDLPGVGCELHLEQGSFATPSRLALHEEGWSQSLDKLDRLLTAEGRA
ncbi:SRPBCC domain-containing protein [Streptomyces sp. OF3]|uniref:SRPBCC domain-containing protein n=1 Tax=Streptomyces alkaliterrae TaxID=2213162 RepID=A0A7W3ZMU5_9ACTN|nr:SRPBCC domain-containing protein [Streptomyces alkaliterrae]MBB1253886.1 SRPBCC domain-containing protein [Streptomyces alkaliterrae]